MPTGPVVLVLTLPERSGWWACHSLSRGGYRPVAAHYLPAPRRLPEGVAPALAVPDPSTASEAFLERVQEICLEKAVEVVLTLDDESQKALLAGPPLPGRAVLCGPTADQYRGLCDKRELAATAAAAGVDHPASVAVGADGSPEGAWPALPVVVKPLLSEPGSVGGEITVCRTERERDEAVARLGAATGGALAQEFVSGVGLRMQFVRSSGALAAILATTVRRWPPVTGMSSVSTYGPVPPDILRAAERLLAQVDYRGGGEVQFIGDDGRLVVHDVNLRPSAGVGGTIRAGLDQPRLMADVALGRPLPSVIRTRRFRYVWRTGELRQLTVAAQGRPSDGTPWEIARDLVRAPLHPQGMLDPTDARSLVAELSSLARRGARRLTG